MYVAHLYDEILGHHRSSRSSFPCGPTTPAPTVSPKIQQAIG